MDLGADITNRRQSWFYSVFVIFIIGYAALVWSPRVYPMVDLPVWLASAEIARHVGDPGSRLANYFAVDWSLKPNMLYTLFCSWSIFPSAEFANRVFLSGYVILVPVMVLLIIRKLGGNIWFSLLSLILIFNISFKWGSVGVLMAMPFALLAFYMMLGYFQRGGVLRGAIIAALLAAIFFMSLPAMLFAAFVFAACCIYRGWKKPAAALIDLAVIMPPLGIFIAWLAISHHTSIGAIYGQVVNYYSHGYLKNISDRAQIAIIDNRHIFAGWKGIGISSALSLPIVIPALWWLIRGRRGVPNRKDPKPINFVLIVMSLSLMLWLALPDALAGGVHVYQRSALVFMLSLIIIGSRVNWQRRKALMQMLIMGAVLVHLMLYADYFDHFERQNVAFTAHSMPRPGESTVMSGLIYAPSFRGLPVYIHWADYFIIWRHGVACTSLADYTSSPIRRRVNKSALPQYVSECKKYDGHYSQIKYILIRGRIPVRDQKYFRHYNLTRICSGWSLYSK